jgi:signal transduction histidine kinase
VPDEPERLDRLIAAEQDERRRLALFLHDGPVQQLAGIALMLDAALHSIRAGQQDDAERVVTTALERQRETIRELRDLSFALEPVILRDEGFVSALRALADQLAATHGVRIEVDGDDAGDLGESMQVTLYTIVAELLDRAVRRGPPRHIAVAVARDTDGGVAVSVADDAAPERRQRPYDTIEERIRPLHGVLAVSAREDGTDVSVTLPPYSASR